MRTPRQRLGRLRLRRRSGPDRLAEQTQIAKQEARELARRERGEEGGRRLKRVRVEGLGPARLVATVMTMIAGLVKGTAEAVRRVMAPVLSALGAALAWIAPPIMRAVWLVLAAAVAVLAGVVDAAQAAGGWLGRRLRAVATAVGAALEAAVTPARALAFVTLAAAGFLAASQFVDFHGVAVSAPQYAGEVGTIADAPLTDLETTGSAHLYLGIPLALGALVLTVLTLRGRWRLGRAVGLIGLAGIALTLIVDLPQGLDAGRAGIAYEGSEARLIEGFWAQLSACAALLVCGPLLGRYVRLAAADATAGEAARGEPARDEQAREEAETGGEGRRRWPFRRRRVRSAKPGAGLEAGA